jgi:hypothetical protein
MDQRPEKITVLSKSVSSPRIVLWVPVLKRLLQEDFAHTYILGDDQDAPQQVHDLVEGFAGTEKDRFTPILDKDQLVLIADTPEQLESFQLHKINAPYGCFLGGINGANLTFQIQCAKEAKVHFLICDLLPSEVKAELSLEDFDYFLQKYIFLPQVEEDFFSPAKPATTLDYIFITDSQSALNQSEIDDIYLSIFRQNKDCKVIDTSEFNSISCLTKALEFGKKTRFIIHNLSVSITQFIVDFSHFHSIELKVLGRNPQYSVERFFLTYNPLILHLFFDAQKEFSIRQKFKSLFETENSQIHSAPETKKNASRNESISQSLIDRGLLTIQGRTPNTEWLENFGAAQQALHHTTCPNDEANYANPFSVLGLHPRHCYLHNAITHFRLLDDQKIQEEFPKKFLSLYANEVIDLFLEQETTDSLINSFTRIIEMEHVVFLETIYSHFKKNLLFQEKIRLLRLVCFSILPHGHDNQRKQKFLVSMQSLHIEIEFKLLLAFYTNDTKWIEENFFELFNSADKLRFYKFFNFCLLNQLPSQTTLRYFVEKHLDQSKQGLPPIIFEHTNILQIILSTDKSSFNENEIAFLDNSLDSSFLLKCVIHCLLNKKESLARSMNETFNKKSLPDLSLLELLQSLCANLLVGNRSKASSLADTILTRDEKIDLNATAPNMLALLSFILAAPSEKEESLANARRLCERFCSNAKDVTHLIQDAIKDNSIEPASVRKVTSLLDPTLSRLL